MFPTLFSLHIEHDLLVILVRCTPVLNLLSLLRRKNIKGELALNPFSLFYFPHFVIDSISHLKNDLFLNVVFTSMEVLCKR